MIKSLLIALTFTVASQVVTPQQSFDAAYRVGIGVCKYYIYSINNYDQAFSLAVAELSKQDRQVIEDLNAYDKDSMERRASIVGIKKALQKCMPTELSDDVHKY
jgi:hypothetical protein